MIVGLEQVRPELGAGLDEVRDRLADNGFTAISEALGEVAEWCGDAPTAVWGQRRAHGAVVYVLAIGSGLLYRLGGEHDPAQLRERITDDRVAACRCGVIPITGEARFWLTTTCRWKHQDGTPGDSRSWTFLVDGIAEPLEVAYRSGEDGVPAFVGDAESFARKLAAEITRAHRQQDERLAR